MLWQAVPCNVAQKYVFEILTNKFARVLLQSLVNLHHDCSILMHNNASKAEIMTVTFLY